MLFGLVALLAVGTVAPSASAVLVPDGPIAASVVDQSSLFIDGGNNDWVAIDDSPSFPPAVGYEQRTIVNINAIDYGSIGADLNGIRINGDQGGYDPYVTGSLSGMLYDVVIGAVGDGTKFYPTALGGVVPDLGYLYFGPGARYTSDGSGSDGTWTDQYGVAQGAAVTASTALGYGGLVVVYADPDLDTNFAGDSDLTTSGHHDWREPGDATAIGHPGAGAMAISSPTGPVLTNADYYPTISDVVATAGDPTGNASPWLAMVLSPLSLTPVDATGNPVAAPPTVLLETPTTTGWLGVAFGNVIGGSFAANVQSDFFGLGKDVRFDFTVTIPTTPYVGALTPEGWQTTSLDPVQLDIKAIPEPASMSLLGLGLLGLVGIRVRKKR
jgi:hypothetical protein